MVVGKATSYDRVVCFWPDNCSVTIVDVNGSTLNLIARGDEAVLTKGSKARIL